MHFCTGKGILVPNALADAGKAKNTKHEGWLKDWGYSFIPSVVSMLGFVSNDAYRILFLLAFLRAEMLDSVALAAAGGVVRGFVKSVEQRRGERESSLLTTYWSGSTDVFGVPASRHGSLNPLFQVAFYLPA